MSHSRFLQITLLTRHSDVTVTRIAVAINNRYLDFVQTHGLFSLVKGNHVDYNLKEILVYVYFGSIVNNPPDEVT